MKRLLYIFCAVAAMTACKALDQNPSTSMTTDTAITTVEDLANAVNGCYYIATYGTMLTMGSELAIYADLIGPDAYQPASSGQNPSRIAQFSLTPADTYGAYAYLYMALANVNNAIEKGSLIAEKDETAPYIAELYAMRGLFQFHLATFFAPIPTSGNTNTMGIVLSDKVFDIELQNSPDLLGLRTRYYQSMVDADNLIKGEHFSGLPQSFIIFICTQDPFNNDLPIYTFRNHCDENLVLVLDDFAVKKFFNANAYAKENDIEIKSFLEYIYNNKPVDDFTDRINNLVTTIKQQEFNRKEYSTVNIHDQDTFRRGKLEGIQQGELQAKIQTAKNMLNKNIPIDVIAECTGLSQETVEQLAKDNLST